MENQEIYFRELTPGSTLQNGKYVIERMIGAGGFGITYYAKHTSLNQYYAIKEFFIDGRCVRNTQRHTVNLQGIQPELFDKYRKKFMEEAQTLVHLDHPNIVKVIDVFEENNTSYIVMSFVQGKTLEKIVQESGPLDYPLAVNYIAQIADAVKYIHQRNILHRDIKPDNIIVTPDNRAVLIDFGSAREFIQDKTQHQTSILTKGYAPIEQYSSTSRKGSYTDIYALGGVFYYILTGCVPMDAATRMTEKMLDPVNINPHVDETANRVIMKAMQMKQEDRYQTVDEFMKGLGIVSKPTDSSKKPNYLLIALIALGAVALAVLGFFLLTKNSSQSDVVDSTADPHEYVRDVSYSNDLMGEGTYSGLALKDSVGNVIPDDTAGIALFAPVDGGSVHKHNRYHGPFKNGVMEGERCRYIFSNGDRYEGSFKQNMFHRGKFIRKSDGIVFEGTFKSGQPYQGTWYDKKGKVLSVVNE